MPEILKYFLIFYFILNSIIVFIALKYDCPKDLIKEKGCFILIKAIIKLFFGGIIFVLIRAVKEF